MEALTTKNTEMARYPAYKDSGVEWLGEIPEHWEVKKMKFLCNIYNGDSIKDDTKNDFESENTNEHPYISTKDIDLSFSTINYENGLRIPVNNKTFKIAPKGSILLCIEGGSAGEKSRFYKSKSMFCKQTSLF